MSLFIDKHLRVDVAFRDAVNSLQPGQFVRREVCVNRPLRCKDSIVSLAYLLVWLLISSKEVIGEEEIKEV